MGRKRRLDQSRHPFNVHPFEALCCGSWHAVDSITIRGGNVSLHFVDDQHSIEAQAPYPDLRIRSRRATLTDCNCFLRPGIDICVFLSRQNTENSNEENHDPVWTDATISSIEREPHEFQCSCRFYVNFYNNQGPLGSVKRSVSEETVIVGISQISILQKLEKDPHEDQMYRWHLSEDCSSLPRTKLFTGSFLFDISWLVSTSVLRQMDFNVRSVDNKICYEILAGDNGSCPAKYDKYLSSINFSVQDEFLLGMKIHSGQANKPEAGSPCDAYEAEIFPDLNLMNLRRSKRRNVQPERYVGCHSLPELDVGVVQARNRKEKWKNEEENEMFLPLSYIFDLKPNSLGDSTNRKKLVQSGKWDIEKLIVYKRRKRKMVDKSCLSNEVKDQNPLAIVPLFTDSSRTLEFDNYNEKSLDSFSREVEEISGNCCNRSSAFKVHGKTPLSVKCCNKASAFKVRRKVSKGLACSETTGVSDDCAFDGKFENMEFINTWERRDSSKKVQRKSYRLPNNRQQSSYEDMTHKRRTLTRADYNKLIASHLENLDLTNKEEPSVIDLWNEFKASSSSNQPIKVEQSSTDVEQQSSTDVEQSSTEDEGEVSDHEMLWEQLNLSLAQAKLEEATKGSAPEGSSSDGLHMNCPHDDLKFDEEIGMICNRCGLVTIKRKNIFPSFEPQYMGSFAENHVNRYDDSEEKVDEDVTLDFPSDEDPSNTPLSDENDNVWALIPELRSKLHLHQKKAFEFLWQNIAGSLNPAEMDQSSENTGGCVISHTPGAGKTFLIIAFLVSYLKLFPGKRPLVLAPKTTLYTWYKEFRKWEIPIPVHLIHGRRTYRVFKQNSIQVGEARKGINARQDVMHVLDCVEKIHKWRSSASVLVMAYPSYLALMRDNSKFEHRRHMATLLRESPGVLILDEGHNPRSTKSKLRKVLMKVKTDIRILLSGTLFQNNFCEYFNTLCLARPKFIFEVLRELNPKYKNTKDRVEKARYLMEARARKLFLDNIAKKIDSRITKERKEGLNVLRNITAGFIDVYEGGSSDGLPGLQIYTILMNSSEIQQEILAKLHKSMDKSTSYPLELELLITLCSIHPWLIKTSVCNHKFFSLQEQMELENLKFDVRKGCKLLFVLNLVSRVVGKEKILIFCHNIAPIKMLAELFEKFFSWQNGREILVLTGDLELFDRGKMIDNFEDANGPSRILLASITACAEGVSLTAASRVILIDSEWNPSKTKQAIARAFRPGQQKMVYVYQLLASGTLEEDKYKRTAWKEWVSSMIFSEDNFVEDPSHWQAQKIEDDTLREMVKEDRAKLIHKIMKNEKASTDSSKKREVIDGLISN